MNGQRFKLKIIGKVQGVCFRMATVEAANKLGVKGWVMNTHDGNVEALIEGSKENCKKLIDWCNVGPPIAKVNNLIKEEETFTGEFHDFQIKY